MLWWLWEGISPCSSPIVKVAQLCPTLHDPMDYTVHGILQARILEWVAFPFSRGSSQPRDWTQVSHITCRFFTSWATWFLTNTLEEVETPVGEKLKGPCRYWGYSPCSSPCPIHCPLPRNTQSIQTLIIGVSDVPIQILKSESISIQLGIIRVKLVFLLVKCAPTHLIGRELLEVNNIHTAFSQKGEMLLDLENLMLNKI